MDANSRMIASPEQEGQHWESVHVCPSCSHTINLAEIDLRAITTGIVSCPHCEWSGAIAIKIVSGYGL
jgi:hypothetical protein